MADTINIKDNYEEETNENRRLGEGKIADEVVAVIAGIAATEVEGVDSMAGNPTKEIVEVRLQRV